MKSIWSFDHSEAFTDRFCGQSFVQEKLTFQPLASGLIYKLVNVMSGLKFGHSFVKKIEACN